MAALVKASNVISDVLATPPTNPQPLDCYKLPSSPQGAWATIPVGRLVVWDGQVWLDMGALSANDLVIVAPSARTPAGSFSSSGGKVGTWSGSTWSFTSPTAGDTAIVIATDAPDARALYCYGPSAWYAQNGLARSVAGTTNAALVSFAPAEVGTTDATVTVVSALTTTPSTNTHTVFDAWAQAIKSDASVAATLRKSATFRRAASAPVQVGSTLDTGSVADAGASTWALDFNINSNAIETRVTGQAATNIAWTVNLAMSRRTTFNAYMSNFGIFAGGTTGSNSAYTDKYVFWTGSVSAATVLGTARNALAGCSNATVGIFASSTYTDRYTFGTNVVSSGTALGVSRSNLGACSNSTIGIFGGGYTGAYSLYADKYTFSTNDVAAATALGTARANLAACGNSTVGVFGGGTIGSASGYTDRYTFSTNAVSAGTALGTPRWALGACSNATLGVFGGGNTGSYSTYTDKYTFVNNSVTAGTVLNTAREALSGCGNATFGIFGGGYTGSNSTYTDRYTFGSDAVVAGTVLGLARQYLGACSNAHGGL